MPLTVEQPLSRPAVRRLMTPTPVALRATRSEWVSSAIVALLVLLGATLGVLLVAWFADRNAAPRLPVKVQFGVLSAKTNSGPVDPGTESDWNELSDAALLAVSPASIAGHLSESLPTVSGAAKFFDGDALTGATESPEPGPLQPRSPEPGGTIPALAGLVQRWEIVFLAGATIDLYARQLDFFGVELAGLDPSKDKIVYVTGLASPQPAIREAPRSDETRDYLTWRPGSALRLADQQLMARAGIRDPQMIVVQFYPNEVIGRLQQLERDFRGRDSKSIIKTRFGVRPQGAGYEFYVLEQVAR